MNNDSIVVMERADLDIRKLFGIEAPQPVLLPGFKEPSADTPRIDEDYVFVKSSLNDLYYFFVSGARALQMIGHTGTGKSSLCEQFHARLNIPLYVYNAHPRTTFADLVGEYVPTETGGLKYVLGPVARAAIEGVSVLIDEYNVIDPGEATGLNALLEGRSIFVKEIETWIHPQVGFRIFTTVNPKTSGYVGRNTQDAANDDRFWFMNVDYMDEESEIGLVEKCLVSYGAPKAHANAMATRFVNVANTVRKQYMGASDSSDALDITISTRSLIRWAQMRMLFEGVSKKQFSPVHYAMERSKTFKASAESRIAIHQYIAQVFEEEYSTPHTLALALALAA